MRPDAHTRQPLARGVGFDPAAPVMKNIIIGSMIVNRVVTCFFNVG
jgi:hypothetical protein